MKDFSFTLLLPSGLPPLKVRVPLSFWVCALLPLMTVGYLECGGPALVKVDVSRCLSILLTRSDPAVREATVNALAKMGRPATTAVVQLVETTNDPQTSAVGASILGQQRDPAAVRALADLLWVSRDPDAAIQAAAALGSIGPAAARAQPALRNRLASSRDSRVLCACEDALGRMGLSAGQAAPDLMLQLGFSQDFRVRASAAHALAAIGAPAVGPLIHLLQTRREPAVLIQADYALGRIGGPAALAVPAMMDVIRTSPDPVRLHTVSALADLGRPAARATPLLIRLLTGPDPALQGEAAHALGEIGPPARRALPILRRLQASSRSPAVRSGAAAAVERLG